jgi:hypothetical protein
MSRFYAEIKGNRGMASRTGFKDSGIWSHTRGWHTGVEVQCSVDDKDEDVIEIYATGGSGASIARRLIATIYQDGFVVGCQIHLSDKVKND